MKTLRVAVAMGIASMCAVVASAQVSAPPAPSTAAVVDMIEFCADRRVRRMERFYPRQAIENNIRGEVRLDCAFTADETLHSCQVIEEAPTGHGFGAAALAMACRHARKPSDLGGDAAQVYTPEGGDMVHVRWPVRFTIAG
ncbi:MAG: energy transducer TonB [Phycisphaerales bacterium]|nr:energy transducer TonB [Hyphomonadaceae bacterium]